MYNKYDYNDLSSIFPLGILSLDAIKKGFLILDVIILEIAKSDYSQETIISLSNQYYTAIPHVDIFPINSLKMVRKEKELLSYMLTV